MNNKKININNVKTKKDNTLNNQQLKFLERKALKEEKFIYIFEITHNNRSISSYEVEISTNFNNHVIAYYINFQTPLEDYKINYHCFVTGKSYSSKEKALESLISRLKIAQENYREHNL